MASRKNTHRGSDVTRATIGQAMQAMAAVAARHLPAGYGYEWTSLSYQEQQGSSAGSSVFVFALIFAYLFLVAQYESWSLPVSVILSVSVAALGALLALWLRGTALDVYGQVGLVLLIGLAAKNAILIVEFAKQGEAHEGLSPAEAAVKAARTRLRPILMTSFAFILGAVPLVLATGAGAGARQSIGTTVFGGMVLATVLGIVFVPVLFIAFEFLAQWSARGFRRQVAGSKAAE